MRACSVLGLAATAWGAIDFVPSQAPNMNGDYKLSPTPNGKPELFPKSFKDYPGGVEYFDVYSDPIETLYSQVWWKPLPPVDLPSDIVERYKGKGMAIVGFEADQVRRTPDGDVSVPISASYNHHYVTTMVGAKAQFEAVQLEGPEDPRLAHLPMSGHGVAYDQVNYIVRETAESASGLPSRQLFDGSNGGEYRMSFHGVAPGHALVVESPTQLQISPMQIDTWNREKMNISSGNAPAYVAGPLPRLSQARPGDVYSGLLECPLTTRITKSVDVAYKMQGKGICAAPITSENECFSAGKTLVGSGAVTTKTGSDAARPAGCSVSRMDSISPPAAEVFFNLHNTSAIPCGSAKSGVVEGSFTSLNHTTVVHLDATSGLATLTVSGPAGVWYGVGFNAERMSDAPWTLVVDGYGNVTEHKLGDHEAGELLKPSVKVVSSSVTAGVRTVVVTRPLIGASHDYYSFDPAAADATVAIINALGSTPDFSYHKIHYPAVLAFLPLGGDGGACVCPDPKPFGQGTGTITYTNTGGKGDVGHGSTGFHKSCRGEPTTDMLSQRNPSCDLRTYTGGMSTCLHMWSLLDKDQDIPWPDQPLIFHHKYRFWVQPYNASYHQGLTRQNNWGLGTPIEFDVPQCGPTVAGCTRREDGLWVHTVKGAFFSTGTLANVHFHCHAPTCLEMSLYSCPKGTPLTECNASTGTLMCKQVPIYGNGDGARYQEPGYIIQNPCLWGKAEHGLEAPWALEDVPLFLIKTSNATVGHYGEMAAAQVYTYPTPK